MRRRILEAYHFPMQTNEQNLHLDRRLGPVAATSIVIGIVIGTGVFLKAAIMTQTVHSPMLVLWAWVAAGILSLAGALTYAELGSLFPQAGGEYVYLKEAYGKLPAFLFGWMRFCIGTPGSIAAFGVGGATFASKVFDLSLVGGRVSFALILIAVFSGLNCLTVAFGGKLQSVMTGLKLILISVVIFGIFGFSESGTFENITSVDSVWPGLSAFGTAMLAALWAFDGWNNLTMVGGEIKNPSRNVPISLIVGMLAIVLIYGLANVAYFYALPVGEILTANSKLHPEAFPVATKAAATFLGENGIWFLSIALFLSAIGAMNGSILSGARVPFAMARDQLFFQGLARLHPKTHVPYVSILIQAVIAGALASTGTFDQLTDYVVFSSWLFYALVTYSIFIFRKKLPNAPRPYKAIGYPILPVVFLASAAFLLVNTVVTSPNETIRGLIIIAAGVPLYWWLQRRKPSKP